MDSHIKPTLKSEFALTKGPDKKVILTDSESPVKSPSDDWLLQKLQRTPDMSKKGGDIHVYGRKLSERDIFFLICLNVPFRKPW